MVFCGRPSKSCERCRKKRLKCDQAVPTCKPCAGAGVDCTGYRQEIDILFRIENEKIAQKYENKHELIDGRPLKNPQSSMPVVSSKTKTTRKSKGRKPADHVLGLSFLGPPIGDIALSFLLSTYIRGSHFEYIPSLYASSTISGLLLLPTKAAALASLSRDSQRPELMVLARKCYAQALTSTNLALRDHRQVQNDETLASVVMLALFETLAQENVDEPTPWDKHAEGALALLSLRGPKQFESSTGLELFRHIGSIIRVKCVQNRHRVPPVLESLSALAAKYLDNSHPVLRFSPIVASLAELQAAMEEQRITDPPDIISWAKKVDLQAVEYAASLLSSWLYDLVYSCDETESVFQRRYHIYKDHRVAQLWNTVRMTRLMINQIIHDQLSIAMGGAVDPETLSDLAMLSASCAHIITEMAEEICASVPQFLPNPPQGKDFQGTTAALGYYLMWPLSVAGGTKVPPPQVREYIIGRFRCIGNELKIPQALRIAERLRGSIGLGNWDNIHVFHLF